MQSSWCSHRIYSQKWILTVNLFFSSGMGRKCPQHLGVQQYTIKRVEDSRSEILCCWCWLWSTTWIDETILRGPISYEGTGNSWPAPNNQEVAVQPFTCLPLKHFWTVVWSYKKNMIIKTPPKFEIKKQVKLIYTICCLWNFIQIAGWVTFGRCLRLTGLLAGIQLFWNLCSISWKWTC